MSHGTITIAGTSLAISRLGFGCARIVGGGEARASARLIEAALRLGIRHFDTAPTYGLGMSEAVVGDVLAGVADVTIATKVGASLPGAATMPSLKQQVYRRLVRPALARAPALKRMLQRPVADTYAVPPTPRPLTLDTLRRSLDRSEAALRRRVDILLLHEPAALLVLDAIAEQLTEWQRAGRIAAFGGGTGGYLPADFALGTVAQEAFRPGAGARPGQTAILHGVLRAAGGSKPAAARLAAALAARPDAAFLVSASIPAQLAALARA